MGKGGGKCASREQSASSTRTPRLPAKKSEKPPVKSSTQASKSSSSKEKVIDPDPSTLVPLISKKESQPAAVEKINDDDYIDTNVTFDQEELDYPASEHGRRLTGASSSEMPSVYNTANASPARSFSSGARSPDTVYLSGSEDIPQYIASPVHPVGMPLTTKHSKAGANSPESAVSSQRRIHNDVDQFLARWAPASSSSSAGPSSGVLRKRHSVAASSTAPLEVRSLTTSSSFPTPGGRIEGKPVPNINSVNKTTDEVNLSGESESRKKDGHLVVEGQIANKEELKPYDSQGAEPSKETLGDNWEMVPAQHQSKGLGPEWISVPTPNITDTKLHVPSSQESKEVEPPEQVNERGIGKPREEPLEVFSSIQPVISIADSVSKAAEGPETPVQEENIMKSVGSDQSDEIETRSLNGEGGDYVFLGTTGSPKTEQSSQDPDLDTDVPESTIALNKLPSSSKGDESPAPNATLQNNEAEDKPIVAHGLREETPIVYDRNEEDREARPLSKSVKEDEETPEVAEKGLAPSAPVPEEKDAPSLGVDTASLEKTAASKHSASDPAELVEEAGTAAPGAPVEGDKVSAPVAERTPLVEEDNIEKVKDAESTFQVVAGEAVPGVQTRELAAPDLKEEKEVEAPPTPVDEAPVVNEDKGEVSSVVEATVEDSPATETEAHVVEEEKRANAVPEVGTEDAPALVEEEVAPVAELPSAPVEEVATLAKEASVPDVVEPPALNEETQSMRPATPVEDPKVEELPVADAEDTPGVVEKVAPAEGEEATPTSPLESETSPMIQLSLPVESMPVELVSPVENVADIAEISALSEDAHVDQPDVEQVHDSKASGVVEASTSEPVVETESGSAAPAEGVSSVEEAVPESLATPGVENLAAEVGEQGGLAVELQENDNPDADRWRTFKQEIEKDTSQAFEGPEATVAEEAKVVEPAAAADAQVETTASARERELLGGLRDVEADSASDEVEVASARVEEPAVPEVEKPTSVVEGINAEEASAVVEEEVKQEATASSATASSATASPLDANAADTALELQSRESELPVAGSEPVSETVSEVQAAPDLDADSPVSEEQAAAVGDGTTVVQHDDAPMDVVEAAPLGNDASTPAVDTAQADEPVASTSSTSATADEVSEVQSREFEIPSTGSEPVPEASSGVEGANEVDDNSTISAVVEDAPAGDDTPVALEQAVPAAVDGAAGLSADAPPPVAEEEKAGKPVTALPEEEDQSETSPAEVIEDSSVVNAGEEAPESAVRSVGEAVTEAHPEVPAGADASDAVDEPNETGVDAVPEAESREIEIPGTGSETVSGAVSEVEGANEGEADSAVAVEQDAPTGDDTPVALEEAVPSGLDSSAPGLEFAKDAGAVVFLSKDEEVDASPVQVVEDSSVVDTSAEAYPTAAEAVADEAAGAQAEVPVIVDESDAAATPDVNAVDTAEEQSREVELPVAVSEPVSQSATEAAPEVMGLTDVEGASSPVEEADSPKVTMVAPGEDASVEFACITGVLKDVE